MGTSQSRLAGLLSRTRKLFSRKDRVYVALIRGDDGRYSEILVTDARGTGKTPDEITVPPRPQPGDKLKVFVAKPDTNGSPVPVATNGEVPSPTEPWRWENPSFANEAVFQEYRKLMEDFRAENFPIEHDEG